MVTQKSLYSESCHILALAGIPEKYNQCHTTLGGSSSVCAKLEPTSLKNNEMIEINDKWPAEIHPACSFDVNLTLWPGGIMN